MKNKILMVPALALTMALGPLCATPAQAYDFASSTVWSWIGLLLPAVQSGRP